MFVNPSYKLQRAHHFDLRQRKRGRSHGAPRFCWWPPQKLSSSIAGSRNNFIIHVVSNKMAATFFNRIAALGLGLAGIGGVVNTALFNG